MMIHDAGLIFQNSDTEDGMHNSDELILAKGKDFLPVLSHMANRHGLIAGATGTGKTVTLRVMAERFSEIGVPVFMADVKGDLSGIAVAGGDKGAVRERVGQLGLDDFTFQGYPVIFLGRFWRAWPPRTHNNI